MKNGAEVESEGTVLNIRLEFGRKNVCITHGEEAAFQVASAELWDKKDCSSESTHPNYWIKILKFI